MAKITRLDGSAKFGNQSRGVSAAGEPLFLPESPHQLIVQGLNQIGQHGAFAGLDKGFYRHSRRQSHVTEMLDFVSAHRDPH
jgi:hypothetical protein